MSYGKFTPVASAAYRIETQTTVAILKYTSSDVTRQTEIL